LSWFPFYFCSQPKAFFGWAVTDIHLISFLKDFGRRFFPPGLVRGSRPFSMTAIKPPNTLRVFVLGESAAMGDPDFKFGLPRMLEALLGERFPQRRIEVINTSVVAINSHVILPIARDCARQQADLWVIYMGNNEIIGPFGSASVFGARAPALFLVRAGLWAKTTRLGQLLDAGLYLARHRDGALAEWGGMEMMAGQKVPYDAPATKRVYSHFEQNLHDVLEIADRAGVPVILCTVATNLKDCGPFASLHRAGLISTQLSDWQAAYNAGVTAETAGDITNATEAYERAARIDDNFAELAFHRGECARLLGEDSQALQFFQQARDRDALQFRADQRVNEIIRRTAAAFGNPRVKLVDAEKLLSDNSPHRLTGAEFFYEHVHLTPEGNYLLAHALAEQAARIFSLEPAGEWLSQPECFRWLGLTDWNRYDGLQVILDRIQSAPFTGQCDHARQVENIDQQLARYRLGTKPAQVRQEVAQVSQMAARRPEDADLRWTLAALLESAGDTAAAGEQWRTLIHLQPQFSLADYNLAKLLDGMGRQKEALPLYLECLRLNPDYSPARYAVGALYLQTGQAAEAVEHLKRAVREKPAFIEARLALGQALAASGRSTDAEKQWREVLRLDPNNAAAQARLRDGM
jgi:tetratricopeptide (TPR) repeat protein